MGDEIGLHVLIIIACSHLYPHFSKQWVHFSEAELWLYCFAMRGICDIMLLTSFLHSSLFSRSVLLLASFWYTSLVPTRSTSSIKPRQISCIVVISFSPPFISTEAILFVSLFPIHFRSFSSWCLISCFKLNIKILLRRQGISTLTFFTLAYAYKTSGILRFRALTFSSIVRFSFSRSLSFSTCTCFPNFFKSRCFFASEEAFLTASSWTNRSRIYNRSTGPSLTKKQYLLHMFIVFDHFRKVI